MRIIFLLLFLLPLKALAEKHYSISFKGYLITDLKDYDHALRRQINHSYGPLVNNYAFGYRSSLNINFTYEILKETKLSDDLVRLDYKYQGELLTEDRVDINNFKVVVPIQAKKTFELAQYSKSCTMRGFRGNLLMFYSAWSPYFKGCALKKGESYEEFSLDSYQEIHNEVSFKTNEFLVNKNELNFFYYFGSDYYSLSRTGYAGQAKKSLERKLKKLGFSFQYDEEVKDIFKKPSKELYSFYTKMSKTINGVKVSIYLLLGNPTEVTPIAQREYFDYFKYAFKKASYIHYSGHAGLGSILDFSYLEKEYNETVSFNQDQKQLFYLDGCTTYFESTKYFFSNKPKKESLVLITNGLNIRTDLVLPGVEATLDALLLSLENSINIDGKELISRINQKIDSIITNNSDFALTNISKN